MKRIYIAGKLSNDNVIGYIHNVHKMMEVAEKIRLEGYSVYVPAIDLLMGIKFGYTKYEDYFNNCQPWLEASDAVFLVPGWETSPGTRREMETADVLDIPIFSEIEKMNEHFSGVKQTSLF